MILRLFRSVGSWFARIEAGELGRPALLVCVLVLFGAASGLSGAIAAFRLYTRHLPIEGAAACPSIPKETASWKAEGEDASMKADVVETLGTHNYLTRVYRERNPPAGSQARVVQLHLAYYTGMVDTVPHVPDRCFVAGGASMTGGPYLVRVPLDRSGWVEDRTASAEARAAGAVGGAGAAGAPIYEAHFGPNSPVPGWVRLPRGIDTLELRVFEFEMPGSELKQYAGYFFIANGGLASSAHNVRLLAFDLRSDYAYYMKVQFMASQLRGPEELAKIAGSMLDEMLPDLMRCVPDWTDVIRGDYPADNPRRSRKAAEPAPA